jgi:hypothetical protein
LPSTRHRPRPHLVRRLARALGGVALLIGVVAAALPAWAESAPSPAALPDSWHLAFDTGKTAAYVTGFKWRKTFDGAWYILEPSPGQYNWAPMDAVVEESRANGQKVMWLFWVPPDWAASDWRSFMPSDPQDLVRFLEAFWDRYAASGVIGAVEVWGEANINRTGRDSDPDDYVRLAQIVHEVTKRKAPGVQVLGGAMSSGWWEDWLRAVFGRGVLDWIDAFSFSAYAELADSNPEGGVSMARSVTRLRALMAEYGAVRPIWITEAGLGVVVRQGSTIPSQEHVNAADEAYGLWPGQPWLLRDGTWRKMSERRAAAVLVRSVVQSMAYGVKRLTWFRHHYEPESYFSWFIDGAASAPRLHVSAHETLSGLLAPGAVLGIVSEALDQGDGSDLYVYSLERPTDRGVVLWRHPRTTTLLPWLWSAPLLPRSITVTLPTDATSVRGLSILGEPVPVGGAGRSVSVSLGDDPVYILYAPASASTPPRNAPPRASLTARPVRGRTPLRVAFTGAGTDSDGTITRYEWNFGDGVSSTLRSPTHTYRLPAGHRRFSYTATLTVTDNRGATASARATITVQR